MGLSSKYLKNTELGQVLPMTALLIIPLFIVSAFALDIGSFYLRGNELQTASDLAALTGAELNGQGASEAEVYDAVKGIIKANGIDESLIDDVQIIDNDVKVSLTDKNVPLYISKLILNDMTISRKSTATIGNCYSECEQPISIVPPLVELPSKGKGDGFAPQIVNDNGDLKIYHVNHHEPSNQYVDTLGTPKIDQLVCISITRVKPCDGFPKRIDTATGDKTKVAVSTATNEVYFLLNRANYPKRNSATDEASLKVGASTIYGLGCIKVSNGDPCNGGNAGKGYYKFGKANFEPPFGGGYYNIGDYGYLTSEPVIYNNKVYITDYQQRVHCFNPKNKKRCWAPKTFSDWQPIKNNGYIGRSGLISNKENIPHNVVSGDKLYTTWGVVGGPSLADGAYATCFDLKSDKACSGFGTPFVGGYPTGIFEYQDSNGSISGFCNFWNANGVYHTDPPDTRVKCVTETGVVNDNNALASLILPSNARSFPFRLGNKLFVADRNNSITYCIDLINTSSCGQIDDNTKPYAYAQIPGQDCIVATGHVPKYKFFNSDFGECEFKSGIITVKKCNCGDGIERWGWVVFDEEFLATFSKFDVTVKTLSGQTLQGPIDVIASGGRIDLRDAPQNLDELNIFFEYKVDSSYTWVNPVNAKVSLIERATLIE